MESIFREWDNKQFVVEYYFFDKEMSINRVLLTCDKENIASAKTIKANGGILENEVKDEVNLSESGVIQRYWIS